MGAVCFAFLWVPASAGMTGGWRGNDGGLRGRGGFNCDLKDGSGVLCFSLGSRLRGNDGGLARE